MFLHVHACMFLHARVCMVVHVSACRGTHGPAWFTLKMPETVPKDLMQRINLCMSASSPTTDLGRGLLLEDGHSLQRDDYTGIFTQYVRKFVLRLGLGCLVICVLIVWLL